MTDRNSSTEDRLEILARCQTRLGYAFQDHLILERALTHSSCATTRLDCNERMEFLGDAVLGMVICDFLYDKHPERREGQLTQQKSHLVSRAVCTQVGIRLNLAEFIFVGKGLREIPDSLIAAAVESVIAAIYLDGGHEPARCFIHAAFAEEMESCDEPETENYKSILQEETQRDGVTIPKYVIEDQRGPDHAREFCVAVMIGETRFQAAWGRSKKEAEQMAARHALEQMATASDAEFSEETSTADTRS